jgi:hypothetical protein
MLEVGLVVVTNDGPAETFWTTLRPISDRFDQGALDSIGATREQTLLYEDPAVAMERAVHFLRQKDDRFTFWSDNNGFDWSFWNYYCHLFIGENPFGFSSRRISDLYSGFTNNLRGGTKWKQYRKTKHTHNAKDDAMGNAEALCHILKMQNIRF